MTVMRVLGLSLMFPTLRHICEYSLPPFLPPSLLPPTIAYLAGKSG